MVAFQELVRTVSGTIPVTSHSKPATTINPLVRAPPTAVLAAKALQEAPLHLPIALLATAVTTKNQPEIDVPYLPDDIQAADDVSISARNCYSVAEVVNKRLPPFPNDPPASIPLQTTSRVASLKDLPPVVPVLAKDASSKTVLPNRTPPLCSSHLQPAAPLLGAEMPPTVSKKKIPPRAKKYTLSEEDFDQTLKVQLADLQNFWMQPSSTKRQAKAVNMTTHTKRRERLLCYLGWAKEHGGVDQPNLKHFDIEHDESNRTRFEQYLTYLKEERQLSNGTIVEMITAAVYVLKFLYARCVMSGGSVT